MLFLIAVIDPLGSIPVYLEATKHFDKSYKKKIALSASSGLKDFFILSNYKIWW